MIRDEPTAKPVLCACGKPATRFYDAPSGGGEARTVCDEHHFVDPCWEDKPLSARPIPEGPRWPWLKVVEDVALSLGHRLVIAKFAPYSGLCGEFLHVRLAGSIEVIVGTDSEVIIKGDADTSWHPMQPRTYVSTAEEFEPVLKRLLVDLPRPNAAYLARLERQRVETE